MTLSTPQNARPLYHVLFVRADARDAAVPVGPLGSGLVAHTVDWDNDDPYPTIARTPDLIVVDFPTARPVDFSLYSRIHGQGQGRPIIVLGPAHDTDCILSLELGADDYLPKPVAAQELTARIRAILRRRDGEKAAVRISGLLAGWDFDTVRRCLVSAQGKDKRLNTVEYEMLRHLIANPFTVLSRDDLAVMLYHRQDRHYELRSIDVFINSLRQKLGDKPPYALIHTERGRGYIFTPASA